MRRHALLGLAAVLLCLAGGVLAWRVWFAPTTLTVAVGPPGGEDARLVGAIAANLARERESVRLRVVTTVDEAASAKALDDGEADLAVIRNDVAMPAHAQTLAVMHRDAALLLAPAGRDIAAVADLKGRKVGIVRRVAANAAVLAAVLEQYEIPIDAVETVPLDDGAGAEAALRAGQVDAILAVGTLSGRTVRGAVAAATRAGEGAAPVFVPVQYADAIAQGSHLYETFEIIRGAFGGSPPRPAEAVTTLAVSHRLVVNTAVSNSTVAELTRLIFAMRPSLVGAIPLANRIEAPDTAKGSPVPVHPGALSFYDNEVETFFDRYDDLIYLSVMGLSVLGSTFAGVLSTAAARRRARTLGLLDRLLGLVRLARAAESAAELDALEHETDEILAHALGNAGRGGLDDAGVSAFSLGLDQARYAIADRRAWLAKRPALVDDTAPRQLAAE